MNRLIIILCVFACGQSYAAGPRKFYASSSTGSDTNTGLLSSAAVQSLAKLNTLVATAVGGDSIFLKAGDVFYGTLAITRSGLQNNPIVVTSYGTGANPIITGLTTLGSWTNLGGNIWQATTSNVRINNNLVLRNGVVQQIGRYPNTNAANGGYLTYTASTQTSITGPALSSTTNWTGAEVAVRINRWTIRRRTVTAHSAGVVSFATMNYTPKTNYGYFFQRDARTLDQDGEWYQGSNFLRMYFGNNNPNAYTVKVPNIDTLITVKASYITIRGIDCDGSAINGIYCQGTASGLTFQNCNITNSGGDGITTWFCSRVLVENCTTNYCLTTGIRIRSSIVTSGVTQYTNSLIRNNTVNHTAQFAGMETLEGTQSGGSGNGIAAFGGDSVQVLNNTVKNSGYNGIQWYARSHAYIKYNFIDTFCTARDDGGGIYTYEAPGAAIYEGTERRIVSNIIDHAIGNANGGGAEAPSANGIYNDEGTWGIVMDSNTVANIAYHGIQGNGNGNMTIRQNTVYNSPTASHAFQRLATEPPQTGFTITGNIFYPYRLRFRDQARNLPSTVTTEQNIARLGTMANNFYSTKTGADTSVRAQTQTSPTGSGTFVEIFRPFSYLTSTVGVETGAVSSANNGTLYYNAASSVRTVLFNGSSYKDPKGITYNNFVTIPAFDSRILIFNGSTINTLPVANAGADKAVTLPATSTTVTGSGTDADGTISGYRWRQMAGPNTANIQSPTSATTLISSLAQGSYSFRLTVTDNSGDSAVDFMQVIVSAANIVPSANAGSDQTITLPTSSTTLTGSGSDQDGTISSYSWVKLSGPTGGTIASPSSASTAINSLVQGTYVFQLTVTDNAAATGSDLVQITVVPANVAPTANAGPDKAIALPVTTSSLSGSGTDVDGTINSYSWAKLSGPPGGVLSAATSANTNVSSLQQGTYVFSLVVTDNGGLTGSDIVQIVVSPANVAPTASAGTDQSFDLPINSTTLTGSGTDNDGSITNYAWTKISGPSATIVSPTAATTSVTGMSEGTYLFQLTVTDNGGLTGTDFIQIVVNPAAPPANIPPVANAGADKSITSPASTTTLVGGGTDADGSVVGYRWTKISGPALGSISSPNLATTNLVGLVVGTYIFQLRVTDNQGDTAIDGVQVVVNAANIPPVANAGSNITITSPASTATLNGSGTDQDGTITTYRWVKLSGPTGGTITSSTSASTGLTALQTGTYYYQLRVTDNAGDTATATVSVTVNAANIPPTASAGPDIVITLPTSTATLVGSGTDVDGTIASYSWTKLSGPTGGAISTPSAATTNVTGLTQGDYFYRLKVTDNSGDTASATMHLTVNAANIPPTVSAGNDQTIQLPVNFTTLTGSATDIDGTIASYEWRLLEGPGGGTIASPNTAVTDITGLIQGTYQYQLKSVDNSGDSAVDVIQITVLEAVNVSPVVTIDGDATVERYLPEDSVTLSGTATDEDGTISTYTWREGGTVLGTGQTFTITGIRVGTHTYILEVEDNDGAKAYATITVIMHPAGTRPEYLILVKPL